MYQPLVSVVVPVYNVEKYLSQCLESIIFQTYKSLEVICVNDGATDGSTEILKKFEHLDSRIKVVTQTNQGLSAARNTGIKHATGSFVTFVDSDDWLESNAIELSLGVFQNEDVDFACFGFYKNKESTKERGFVYKYSSDEIFNASDREILNLGVSACGKIYRTKFLKEHNLLFPVGLYYEDVFFHWGCISYAKKIAQCKTMFYNYRVHSVSIMGNSRIKKKGMAIHHLYQLERIYNLWVENGFLNENRELFDFVFDKYVKAGYKFLHNDEKAEYVDKTRECLQAWNLIPMKFTFTYDLVAGNDLFPMKYRLALSIRKRMSKLKRILKC